MMKTNILKIAAIVLVFTGSFGSCKEKNIDKEIYIANGKIIGYTSCYGNFGLFIITEQQDSLLSFNISPSSVNIDRDFSKPGAYPIENVDITFTYRIAYGEEIIPFTELVCFQNAMDPVWEVPIENYKQIIVTNITRQQP